MRKILVTAISGDVSNGILRALKEKGEELYGCDIGDYPVGIDKVKKFWKSDLAVSNLFIPNLLSKCKEWGVTHLIPVNEKEIDAIDKNRKTFENEKIKVVINSHEILRYCLDKYNTMKLLSENGFTVPRTYLFNEFKSDGEDYIVKYRSYNKTKFIKLVKDLNEIGNFEQIKKEVIIQQYIPGEEDEYTVGVFSDGIIINTIIFKRRLKNGYTDWVELKKDSEIQNLASNVARLLDLKGSINIQLRKYKGENYIFEINPRISGTIYFRYMLGFEDVKWWLDMLDGKSGIEFKNNYIEAIGRRELTEKYIYRRRKEENKK